jgi:hypothetical protein
MASALTRTMDAPGACTARRAGGQVMFGWRGGSTVQVGTTPSTSPQSSIRLVPLVMKAAPSRTSHSRTG